MSDRKATLTAVLIDAVSGTAAKIRGEINGIGTSVTKVGSILQGIGQGLGQEIFRGISEGISKLAEIIPSLVEMGNTYLEQLHMVQLETGMTAEQTSLLIGTFKNLGVPMEAVDTLFARLGKNLGANEGKFRQLGVATRDSNGNMLSSYQIVENLRKAVSEHGESLLSTAAAQELFGRGAYQLLPFLQATSAQMKTATDNVRGFGGIFSQSAIDGAVAFGRTLESLRAGIADIGGQIAGAVDPYLRAFVTAFSDFVKSHLNEIVQFAVTVVNVITGFISGLFGITSALAVTNDAANASSDAADKSAAALKKWLAGVNAGAAGTDAFSKAIEAQIKAIDAQAAAVQQAAEKRRAIQERARLADSLAAAQAQLADLRGNAPFLGGLSGGEQALALQKHAQDIIDAEKNVRDQRQAIGNFEADQKDRAEAELARRQKARLQDELAAHKAANAEILQSGLRMGAGLDAGLGNVLGNLNVKTAEFAKNAAGSFQTGIDAARGFIDILLGAETAGTGVGPHGSATVRTGGVAGALGSFGDALRSLGGIVGAVLTGMRTGMTVIGGLVGGFATQLRDAATVIGTALDVLNTSIVNFLNFLRGLPFVGNVIPGLATGGKVKGSPEGTIVRVGEGGHDEYVLSEDQLRRSGGGGDQVIHTHVYLDGKEIAKVVSRRIAGDLLHAPVTSKPYGAF